MLRKMNKLITRVSLLLVLVVQFSEQRSVPLKSYLLKEGGNSTYNGTCPFGSHCSWRHPGPQNPNSHLITTGQELLLNNKSENGEYVYWDDKNEVEVDGIFVHRG